ncbi:mandelate racemase/muconate lactonizing enzyme family protein [Phyllobacterium sophorae]|uniref:Mandelate racemase/muconate lactonizing enzyme family protein n=1 Tax=Phyllobacterium sophorae TaxID=1520277 RepID=A0A2P7BG24_9HYPH|nr:mandelate racemase/muconate lactonizing enzyme family protein [Phyllobacterium sophorae]PSH65368.1 mandelate racemase/muconate lactonizing enzyme family protein [Phyllobacterium sophorae]
MHITALKTFMQRVDDRPRLLVKVETSEGISGWGEAYNHGPDWALPPMLEYLFHQIEGEDPCRVEYLILKLNQQARFPPGALGLAAISAIDHALWDIAGKAAGLPVYMLLGGNVRERVRIYCGLYTAPDPEAVLDQTLQLNQDHGYTAFKLSPYRRDLHNSRWGELVRETGDYFGRIREITPSLFEFAFDAHAKIYEPYQAVQLAAAIAPYDPLFYEEPIRPEHIPAWAELKSKVTVPLATGESLYNRFEFLALLTARGADIIQPDICVVGGMTEMRRIAAIAEAHYVTVAPHNPMGPLATAVNIHFCAAQPNFKILEYKPHVHAPWALDPYIPVDGHMELRPDRPGWGIEIDEKALVEEDHIHWERKITKKPDGSTAYP